jgi:mono/diheme cytochrome c family protein
MKRTKPSFKHRHLMKNVIIHTFIALTLLIGNFVAQPASSADAVRKGAATVTFNKDVAPIFFKNCAECHRPGEAAPMSLLSFQNARPWAKSIREKVISREMPPWHADPRHGEFKNDRRLTRTEIDTITAWVDGGAIEGDARDLPPVPKFVEGWGIGQPDVVLQMPEEYTLEANGPDEYQYFTIPTNFTVDRYVQAAELRPGNRKIVHHLLAFIQPPSEPGEPQLSKEEAANLRAKMERESILYQDGFVQRVKADAPVHDNGCQLPNGGAGRGRNVAERNSPSHMLTVYAPGRDVNIWEPGTARLIPAGAKIVLQVHYAKATGSVEKDRSSLGLIFAKEPPTRPQASEMIYNSYFQIPPGAVRHRATACWTTSKDMRLTAIMPHMHMRGTAIEVKAVYPDGHTAVLLNVPKYDFSWQTNYSLKQPLTVPRGTRFIVTSYFDNSAGNKFNPDPAKAVRWGEPTYDEMLACFIEYTQEAEPAATISSGQSSRQ